MPLVCKRTIWEEKLGLHRLVIVIKSVSTRKVANIHRLSFLGKDGAVFNACKSMLDMADNGSKDWKRSASTN